MKKQIGTRQTGLKKHEAFEKALNFAGLSYRTTGNKYFPNGEHKGYKLYSYGVQIGISDSLENVSNLLVLEGKLEGLSIQGSKQLLKFIGGLEIFDNHLFSNETLRNFSKCDFIQEVSIETVKNNHANKKVRDLEILLNKEINSKKPSDNKIARIAKVLAKAKEEA